ncbi:MAG: hypothetical protein ACQEVA_00040 [Myxococcota bacterium]
MMKQGFETYLELSENGRPLDEEIGTPNIRQALIRINALATEAGGLETEAAWRLRAREARRLEELAGYSPPGGWAALAELACGCGVLEATNERFESSIEPDDLAAWTERDTRRSLVESFSKRLVPPSSAAGLFILLGMHPAWGLRIAHEVADVDVLGVDGESVMRPGWRDSTIFPPETAEVLLAATFGSIAAILETLDELNMDQKYPVDALAGWIGGVCRGFRERASTHLEAAGAPGVPAFLSSEGLEAVRSNFRIRDFTVRDLLDSVLIPAGVLRRFDDGTFCVLADVARDAAVHDMSSEQRAAALAWAMAGEDGFMVA